MRLTSTSTTQMQTGTKGWTCCTTTQIQSLLFIASVERVCSYVRSNVSPMSAKTTLQPSTNSPRRREKHTPLKTINVFRFVLLECSPALHTQPRKPNAHGPRGKKDALKPQSGCHVTQKKKKKKIKVCQETDSLGSFAFYYVIFGKF